VPHCSNEDNPLDASGGLGKLLKWLLVSNVRDVDLQVLSLLGMETSTEKGKWVGIEG
jgi:hypothetical protein